MATTSQWFAQSGGNLIASLWVPRQMGVALLGAGYTPNIDTHLRFSDVVAQEISGTGYTAGGSQISGRSTSYDSANDEYNLIGSDLSWGPGATISPRYGVIYEMVTTDKWLWALLDFGAVITVNNGVFQIDWNTNLLSVKAGPPV